MRTARVPQEDRDHNDDLNTIKQGQTMNQLNDSDRHPLDPSGQNRLHRRAQDIPVTQPGDRCSQEGLADVLDMTGHIAYEWNLDNDVLRWSGDAAALLGLERAGNLACGREYAACMDPGNEVTRYDAVIDSRAIDEGNGVPFQIEYRVLTRGRRASDGIWVEDTGRWFAGTDGRPIRVAGLVRVISDRHAREEKLTYLSAHDALTGFVNRTRLTEMLEKSVEEALNKRLNIAFALIAIDNLAMINQAFGYDAGDEVVAGVAGKLGAKMRKGDVIGRYAGNKFGLVLHNCGRDEIETALDRFRAAVREDVIGTSSGPVVVTVSVGAVLVPRCGTTAQEAMNLSESALDEARRDKVDSAVLHRDADALNARQASNRHMAYKIVAALNDGTVLPAYQPIVAAASEQIAYHECLMRIVNHNSQIVSAGSLIRLSEDLGLVRLIDHRMLMLALDALDANPELKLSLNVSGLTSTCPEWLETLKARLAGHPDQGRRLIVEITETAALHHIEQTIQFIEELHGLGCQVAIDDFGTGYTSFYNLRRLAIDIVKIDGSFIDGLQDNADNQYFTRTLIDLAKNIGMKTVAEWVHEPATADLLREWGIDFMQGYLFGRPETHIVGKGNAGNGEELAIPA
ncbi:MAG TPA: phosphodiesterase [Rhizobiales bacterium]|nr:phosphodiesterase [Hyphomicrobiales bacterium]